MGREKARRFAVCCTGWWGEVICTVHHWRNLLYGSDNEICVYFADVDVRGEDIKGFGLGSWNRGGERCERFARVHTQLLSTKDQCAVERGSGYEGLTMIACLGLRALSASIRGAVGIVDPVRMYVLGGLFTPNPYSAGGGGQWLHLV